MHLLSKACIYTYGYTSNAHSSRACSAEVELMSARNSHIYINTSVPSSFQVVQLYNDQQVHLPVLQLSPDTHNNLRYRRNKALTGRSSIVH